MPLKLNGKDFSLKTPLPGIATVLAFLDKAKPDELYDQKELARLCGIGPAYVKDRSASFPSQYTLKVGPRRFFGNPKAIATLRKQVSQ